MKTITLALLTIFLFAGMNDGLRAQDKKIQQGDADPGILIFSTSHDQTTQTTEREGIITLDIRSFSPVVRITINDIPIEHPEESSIQIEHPYSLSPGDNELTVKVYSEMGEKSQTYVINLEEAQAKEKQAFHLVGIFGVSNLDNVYNVKEDSDKESASKAALAVVPVYTFDIDQDSSVQLMGIVYREKYSDSDYEESEISYTRISGQYRLKDWGFERVFFELGANDIKTKNESILIGSEESSVESYFLGGLKSDIDPRLRWGAELQYKLVDSKLEVSDSGDNADGGELEAKGLLYYENAGLKGTGWLSYINYDAKGEYKDSSTIEIGADGDFAVGGWIPGGFLKFEEQTMSNEDPRQEETLKYRLTNFEVRIKYKLFSYLQFGLAYRSKSLTSNISEYDYTANEIKLSAIYIY